MKHIFIFISAFIALSFLVTACGSDESAAENKAAEQTEEKQLWTCGMHPEVILEEPGQCPKCGMNLVPLKKNEDVTAGNKPQGKGKILYWQAPMNPTEIYDKPGKSKMGMDLVPVYENEVTSGNLVKIDPVTQQNMGVRTTAVTRSDFSRPIRTVGKVDYNEEKIYVVSSKISGWIEKLDVDYTGKEVRKGQTLLEIYSPELVTTQQEYLLAVKNKETIGNSPFASIREGAESLLKSTRQRLLYWDIPQSEIKRLEETGQVRKTLRLESPANGVVTHKNAIEGLHVKEGMSLYQISDLSTVWIYTSIYDNEAPWIKLGQKADMELSYLPGKTFTGKVAYIYPYLNEKARDVKVRLEFPNRDLQLRPGMYANVKIYTEPIHNALLVPTEAVIRSGQRNLVFVDRGEGRFEPREVIIGEESEDGRIRIVSGLLEDEKVVVSAQFLLDSESRLQEAIQKMLAEKSGTGSEKVKRSAGEMDENDMEQDSDHQKMEHKGMDMPSSFDDQMKNDDEKKSQSDSGESEMKCGAGKCGDGK